MSLPIFDIPYNALLKLGFSDSTAGSTAMGVAFVISILVLAAVGYGIRALWRKAMAPPAEAELFNDCAEKKENFPSMSELAARAKKVASDTVAGAKKLVGA